MKTHIHTSTCTTSHARHTSSTRFFTKILPAFAVGLFAFLLATPNAEAIRFKDFVEKTIEKIGENTSDAIINAPKNARERSKKKAEDKKKKEEEKAAAEKARLEDEKAKAEAEKANAEAEKATAEAAKANAAAGAEAKAKIAEIRAMLDAETKTESPQP